MLTDSLVHLGRNPQISGRAVNLPIYQSSTMLFDTVAEFEQARETRYETGTLYYGRYGNPATFELENMMAELEGGDGCISVSSGLTAVSIAVMAAAEAGAHVLVADNVYGPTRLFCDNVLIRFGVDVTYFDPIIGSGVADLMRDATSAVLFEAPGSGTFEVPDIAAIADAARAHGAISILDGTWATPVFCQPLSLGVDIVAHSGSKYICGHADAMIGFIVCKAAHYDQMRRMVLAYGDRAGATDIFLALRGLRTLELRMRNHHEAGMKIAHWFADRPEVRRVLHPALPDCPGHEHWSSQFSGAGGLFSVEFVSATHAQSCAFIDALRLFSVGLSWGGFESLALPVDPSAMRTATLWENRGTLIRFNIGNESPESLIADLEQSIHHLT
ncbi:MAG: cystathionine beta-lyase [Pseudomonadota bacterium]